jgi:hypothetical protein
MCRESEEEERTWSWALGCEKRAKTSADPSSEMQAPPAWSEVYATSQTPLNIDPGGLAGPLFTVHTTCSALRFSQVVKEGQVKDCGREELSEYLIQLARSHERVIIS